MDITFDPAKDAKNIAKHHVSLTRFLDMDEATMVSFPSAQQTSDEVRYIVFGLIDERVYRAIITLRGSVVRVISLHKANPRDQRKYEKAFHV